MRINFRASPSLEPCEIAGVVEMAVREENRFHGSRSKVKLAHESPNEDWFAEQSRVQHHAFVAGHQQMAASHDAANGMEAWRDVAHGG